MITINYFNNISEDCINTIYNFTEKIMCDLNMKKMTINILSDDEICDSLGTCYSDKEIDIAYDNDVNNMLIAIAHEIRHAYQRYNRWFVKNKWLGKSYDNIPYDSLPWEIDAKAYETNALISI